MNLLLTNVGFFHNDIKPDRTFKYRISELVTRQKEYLSRQS